MNKRSTKIWSIFYCFLTLLSFISADHAQGQDSQLSIDYKKSGASVSYDKFKDESTIRTIIDLGDRRLALGWGNSGNRINKSPGMALIVSGDSVDSISFIADDQRFTLDLKNNGVALDSDTIRKLCSANVIELQIGDSTFTLKKGTNLYNPSDPRYERLHSFLDYFINFPDNY